MNAPGDPIGLAEALHQLAAEAGIHESYWDIVGNLHVTPPETKRAILGAMGIPAETDAAATPSGSSQATERGEGRNLEPSIWVAMVTWSSQRRRASGSSLRFRRQRW